MPRGRAVGAGPSPFWNRAPPPPPPFCSAKNVLNTRLCSIYRKGRFWNRKPTQLFKNFAARFARRSLTIMVSSLLRGEPLSLTVFNDAIGHWDTLWVGKLLSPRPQETPVEGFLETVRYTVRKRLRTTVLEGVLVDLCVNINSSKICAPPPPP